MLKEKRILVVGGSSGIGLAVAKQARRVGAQVLIASREATALAGSLSDRSGTQIETYSFDIASPEDHGRLFEATGAIDHLVITVRPQTDPSSFRATDIDKARQAFETKFWGQYRLIQAALPYIRKDGSVVLTSGIAGEKTYKGASTMAVINSATEALCRTLAVELAPLRVNVVSPGFVEPKPQPVRELARTFPAGRPARPDEVASAYLWLIANPYVTGTVMVVDGGARLV